MATKHDLEKLLQWRRLANLRRTPAFLPHAEVKQGGDRST